MYAWQCLESDTREPNATNRKCSDEHSSSISTSNIHESFALLLLAKSVVGWFGSIRFDSFRFVSFYFSFISLSLASPLSLSHASWEFLSFSCLPQHFRSTSHRVFVATACMCALLFRSFLFRCCYHRRFHCSRRRSRCCLSFFRCWLIFAFQHLPSSSISSCCLAFYHFGTVQCAVVNAHSTNTYTYARTHMWSILYFSSPSALHVNHIVNWLLKTLCCICRQTSNFWDFRFLVEQT